MLHDIERGESSHGVGRGQGSREHEGAGRMFNVVDEHLCSLQQTAERREALRESTHDEIDLVGKTEVPGSAAAATSMPSGCASST